MAARKQAQGGNRGQKGSSAKPKPARVSKRTKQESGDFGVRADKTTERNYVSANTKAADPGAAHPHAGENDERTSGVGSNATGVGSGSGGDLDTDVVGLDGRGLAQSGPIDRGDDDSVRPDDSDGTSREFASGPPATGKRGKKYQKVEGSTIDHSGGDIETTAEGRGASAVNRKPRGDMDDSFVGEISEGEASGQDNP
jgi:hypothetical protein